MQRINLNRDADVCNIDKYLCHEYTYICQWKLYRKDFCRLFKLIALNRQILILFFKTLISQREIYSMKDLIFIYNELTHCHRPRELFMQ